MRKWFRFTLPASIAWVPGDTEDDARRVLARNCYDGAPVASWPCDPIATIGTRADLLATHLGPEREWFEKTHAEFAESRHVAAALAYNLALHRGPRSD